jgi:branched-chain amino acid transport system permease protein
MYHLIILRIRGMQISEIIATYAIGLAIIEGLRWGGLRGSTFTLPSFLAGSVGIGGIAVDNQRLFVLGSGVVVFAALGLFVKFTKTGLALKAIAQDERAAMMLGIDSDRKALVSFALGSGLSAFAAILILPLGSIVVETGYNVLIYSIAVSIIGGLGSWGGAIVASFIIGFAQILTEVFLSTQYQMVISLLAIIVTLLLKPSGIFGKQKELDDRV